MHTEIVYTNNIDTKDNTFVDFIYNGEYNSLQSSNEGREILLFNKQYPIIIQFFIKNKVKFDIKDDIFHGNISNLYFDKYFNKYYNNSCLSFFVASSLLKLQISFDCPFKHKNESEYLETFYQEKKKNTFCDNIIGFFGNFKNNMSVYNIRDTTKLYENKVSKIDLSKSNQVSLLCDNGNSLIEIFYKNTSDNKDNNCSLNFRNITGNMLLYNFSADKCDKKTKIDIEYKLRPYNIDYVYNNYNYKITNNIYGNIKTWVYILYIFINRFINNDSWSVIATYELLIIFFFLLIIVGLIITKIFINGEKLFVVKPSSGVINDNQSRFNNNLQRILMIINLPLFVLFIMYIPYIWHGISFINYLVSNWTIISPDKTIVNTGLISITFGRIVLSISCFLHSFIHYITDKNVIKSINLKSILLTSFIISVCLAKVDAPIINVILMSIFFINRIFMSLLIRLIFGLNIKF